MEIDVVHPQDLIGNVVFGAQHQLASDLLDSHVLLPDPEAFSESLA